MFVSLNRLQIGNVSVIPGFVCLHTDYTLSDIEAAGFINTNQRYSPVTVLSTDMVFAACADGNAYYTVSIADGVITLNKVGGGPA